MVSTVLLVRSFLCNFRNVSYRASTILHKSFHYHYYRAPGCIIWDRNKFQTEGDIGHSFSRHKCLVSTSNVFYILIITLDMSELCVNKSSELKASVHPLASVRTLLGLPSEDEVLSISQFDDFLVKW